VLFRSQIKGSSQIGITNSGNYVGLTTNINFVGVGMTVNSTYNSTLGITTLTFLASESSSPGGSENQVQYYSNGTFVGSENFTFNGNDINIIGVSTSSRFISTVSNGTAPISVASSTLVTNLNSNYINGYNASSANSPNSVVLRNTSGNFQAGFITATGFIGSIFDANTSNLSNIYGSNSYYTNSFINVGVITTVTITNSNLNRVNIVGIVTVANNPVLIGVANSTGTQAQRLQVEGKGYFSDSVGIGNTNPNSKLTVIGDGSFSGVVTATSFDGIIRGSTLNITGISTLNNITAGVVTATSFNGIIRASTVDVTGITTLSGQTNLTEIKETVGTLGTSGSIALNPANGSILTSVLTGTATFTDSLESGQTVVLMIEGGDIYSVTWPTLTWVSSEGNTAPILYGSDTIVFWKVSTTLYGAYVGNYN
jgi:hypothetical protein